MPLYEFSFCDDDGIEHQFEEFVSLADIEAKKPIMSPCGTYEAKRLLGNITFIYGPTLAEKRQFVSGKRSLADRKEMTQLVRQQRDERKRTAEAGSYAAQSNELWVGSEKTEGLIDQDKKIKSNPLLLAPSNVAGEAAAKTEGS